ncbi:MAG: hypothetical protein D3925_00395 [Candidatus Electrothrix sp. AR5]|nr:hypothetical protein [Candidatus Electrothrix sp. AR5]
MGFTKYPESDSLKIHFGIIRAYSLQGVFFSPNTTPQNSDVVSFGENCTVTISNSINEACRLLTGDTFVDEDEKEWVKEKKTNPPFVLIFYKETYPRILKGGYRKEGEGIIQTYDAFPKEKFDIKKWEEESLPRIYLALIVRFSKLDRFASLLPVARSIFGTTDTGMTVFNTKCTINGTCIVSSGEESKDINESLGKSSALFEGLIYKHISHLYYALNESDRLKQFMVFFYLSSGTRIVNLSC